MLPARVESRLEGHSPNRDPLFWGRRANGLTRGEHRPVWIALVEILLSIGEGGHGAAAGQTHKEPEQKESSHTNTVARACHWVKVSGRIRRALDTHGSYLGPTPQPLRSHLPANHGFVE